MKGKQWVKTPNEEHLNEAAKDFKDLELSDEAGIVVTKDMKSSQARKIRAMSLLARGRKDVEICHLLDITPQTLCKYKKDQFVQSGVKSIQAKIVQKTELIVDSISEKRIEVATEAQQVLREIMLDRENKTETRLKAASYLVEPLTRYFQSASQTSTLSFEGANPNLIMDDISEIRALLSNPKITNKNNQICEVEITNSDNSE